MAQFNIIAADVHCQHTVLGYTTPTGQLVQSWQVPTTIPQLSALLQSIPRPNVLVFEEGPLADWLCRELTPYVDRLVVCDPYRNPLIAKDGDKDDPIDWQKLAALYRGGFIRPVHHPQEILRSIFKQRLQLYHNSVRDRVRQALHILWQLRRWGIMAKEKDLADAPRQQTLLLPLAQQPLLLPLAQQPLVQEDLQLLLEGYDQAAQQVRTLRQRVIHLAKDQAIIRAFQQLPGIGWIRASTFFASTFFALVDTPWRFPSKSALWKYCGLGLERRQSGQGPLHLHLVRRCNRRLKSVLMGAAQSAIAAPNNVFAEQYERWLNAGCSPRIARRNVARSQAATMWGMWKNGNAFDPRLIGAATCAIRS